MSIRPISHIASDDLHLHRHRDDVRRGQILGIEFRVLVLALEPWPAVHAIVPRVGHQPLAVLFWPLIQSLISEGFTYRGPQHFRDFARHLLGGFYKRLAVPRKTQESLVALIDSHLRFHRIMSRRAARGSFSRTPHYREAFIFAEIRSAAGDLNQSTYAQWKALTAEFPFGPQVKKYRRGWKR